MRLSHPSIKQVSLGAGIATPIIAAIIGFVILKPATMHTPSRHSSNATVLPATTSPSVTPSPSPSPTQQAAAKAATKRRNPTPTPAPVPPTATSTRLGFAPGSNIASQSNAQVNAIFDGMRAAGATRVRLDIEWSNIEAAGPGHYNWAPYDRLVSLATAKGLRVLGILDYTPSWARPADCDSSACAPANPATYAQFAGVAAAHYRGLGVHEWEIWNEPNSIDFFKPTADAARYTALLNGAYASIKAADSSAMVITGGMSPAESADGRLSPPDFVTGLYANGAHFDAIGDHPYTYPVTTSYNNPDNAWGQVTTIRNIMIAHGDAGKQIWLTEYGAPTNGPGPLATTNAYVPGAFKVSETLQGQMVTDVFANVRARPWLGPLFWYSYQDAGTSTSNNENFFGLLRADGSPKPAFDVFRTLAGTL